MKKPPIDSSTNIFNDFIVTLDTDWAPDFVIDWAAEQLVQRQVCATWFVTHRSPAIERLKDHPHLFELGIHPNFLPGSTQGTDPEAILKYCMDLVPNAVSMRTHGLVQSTHLLEQVMKQTGITVDVSLFLPHTPQLRPVEFPWNGRMLLRIPYIWEDDFEMMRAVPGWNFPAFMPASEGLKVFDFHPIHVYLNSSNMDAYTALKQRAPKLIDAAPKITDDLIQPGEGTRTMLLGLIDHLAKAGRSRCIRDLYQQWLKLLGENENESCRAGKNPMVV